jgi:hypothetical protein
VMELIRLLPGRYTPIPIMISGYSIVSDSDGRWLRIVGC